MDHTRPQHATSRHDHRQRRARRGVRGVVRAHAVQRTERMDAAAALGHRQPARPGVGLVQPGHDATARQLQLGAAQLECRSDHQRTAHGAHQHGQRRRRRRAYDAPLRRRRAAGERRHPRCKRRVWRSAALSLPVAGQLRGRGHPPLPLRPALVSLAATARAVAAAARILVTRRAAARHLRRRVGHARPQHASRHDHRQRRARRGVRGVVRAPAVQRAEQLDAAAALGHQRPAWPGVGLVPPGHDATASQLQLRDALLECRSDHQRTAHGAHQHGQRRQRRRAYDAPLRRRRAGCERRHPRHKRRVWRSAALSLLGAQLHRWHSEQLRVLRRVVRHVRRRRLRNASRGLERVLHWHHYLQ